MRLSLPLLMLFVAACTRGGGPETSPPDAAGAPPNHTPPGDTTLVGPVWLLDSLPGLTNITGNGGRRPELRFDLDGNAGGFSGCNSMGGPYTISGDSLDVGPLVMTMMACEDGMEVERALGAALERVVRFVRRDSTLELLDSTGLVARFRVR